MRRGNLGLSFLVELAAFAALAYAGARLGSGVTAVVLAVLLPAIAIAVWARFSAPRSAHRLSAAPRMVCEVAVYAVAVTLLAVVGAGALAAVLGVLVVVNLVGLVVFRQWEA